MSQRGREIAIDNKWRDSEDIREKIARVVMN